MAGIPSKHKELGGLASGLPFCISKALIGKDWAKRRGNVARADIAHPTTLNFAALFRTSGSTRPRISCVRHLNSLYFKDS
ncbi:hypothetical protein V496_03957 [Pseudogymnoascus sp. VKM F-4515 (FW-2607)]|nr:hypothetical protein V496_03957 [Pseudogymnoascus sp. VKM F-4515 (FW-2607)]